MFLETYWLNLYHMFEDHDDCVCNSDVHGDNSRILMLPPGPFPRAVLNRVIKELQGQGESCSIEKVTSLRGTDLPEDTVLLHATPHTRRRILAVLDYALGLP